MCSIEVLCNDEMLEQEAVGITGDFKVTKHYKDIKKPLKQLSLIE